MGPGGVDGNKIRKQIGTQGKIGSGTRGVGRKKKNINTGIQVDRDGLLGVDGKKRII